MTSIQGEGLQMLPDHERLNLYMNSCPVSTAALTEFARTHPSTVLLSLNSTPVDDKCLSEVARMPNLEDLRIAHTNVTDAGLAQLLGHRNLRCLYVTGTKSTPSMREELKLKAPMALSVFS